MKVKDNPWIILGTFFLALLGMVGLAAWHLLEGSSHTAEQPSVETQQQTATVASVVTCDFEKPLKHLTFIAHWYETYDELQKAYNALAERDTEIAVWGWSECMWEPEDDFAVCDLHVVAPLFVRANDAMDTLGHEVFHGACGSFHE